MWSWRHEVSGPAHQNRLSICFKWNCLRIHSIIEEGAQASRLSTDINNWLCLNSGLPPFLQRLRTHPLALSAHIPKKSSSQLRSDPFQLPHRAAAKTKYMECAHWSNGEQFSNISSNGAMDLGVIFLALDPWTFGTFVGRDGLGVLFNVKLPSGNFT